MIISLSDIIFVSLSDIVSSFKKTNYFLDSLQLFIRDSESLILVSSFGKITMSFKKVNLFMK
jgi:hypothetical protein